MLGINSPAVTIKNIENSIIDYGFQHGWVHPMPPAVRTGRKIAVVGSGPAGLAAAAQLNKVLERAGGAYGFNLHRWLEDAKSQAGEHSCDVADDGEAAEM